MTTTLKHELTSNRHFPLFFELLIQRVVKFINRLTFRTIKDYGKRVAPGPLVLKRATDHRWGEPKFLYEIVAGQNHSLVCVCVSSNKKKKNDTHT